MSQMNSQSTQAVASGTSLVPGLGAPLQGGQQQMVSLKTVLENVLERTYGDFDGLLQHGPTLADKDR
jgi:hypothetical protein